MKQCLLLFIITISFSYSHDLDKENLDWRQYYRLGSVYSESSDIGHSWYGRLKRTTSFTFRDVRFFGNFYKMKFTSYEEGIKKVVAQDEVLDNAITRDLFYLGKALGAKYNNLRWW